MPTPTATQRSDLTPTQIAEAIVEQISYQYGVKCYIGKGYDAGDDLIKAIADAIRDFNHPPHDVRGDD